MDTPADLESFQDDADDTLYMPPPRKSKRRLVQLLNLRPSVWFRTAGVIGPPDSPTYVIEVEVDGQVELELVFLQLCLSTPVASRALQYDTVCDIVIHQQTLVKLNLLKLL